MSAYNRQLLLTVAFMLHPCMSIFFSNPMHPETVSHIANCSDYPGDILALPWNCLMYYYNLQPPQGLIMESLFYSTAIISTVLRFMQLYCYLIQNKQNHRLKRNEHRKKTYLIITTAFNSKAFSSVIFDIIPLSSVI